MKLILSVLVLVFSASTFATDLMAQASTTAPHQLNQKVKEQVEDIKGTLVKPTTEQTATVSKAAVRAKKLKKKDQ